MTDTVYTAIGKLVGPATLRAFEFFGELSVIPRPSRKEAKVRSWLQALAERYEWESRSDTEGNVVLRVPASPGREHEPVIVLQGHQDMVCEKLPDSTHDFDRDPIELSVKDEWLTARGTTLGADNGIAIALALALATDPELSHPGLELLFTVDEETGLTGASRLDPSLLQGRSLINIDSEDEGVLTVGCAGGTDTGISIDLSRSGQSGGACFRLSVGGLRGGHSGVDIHLKRANANVILAHALRHIADTYGIRLVSVDGGSAHNAIPRDAHAVFEGEMAFGALESIGRDLTEAFRKQYGSWEPNGIISVSSADCSGRSADGQSTNKLIDLLCGLPHGIVGMSPDIPGLVETSVNFATIKTDGDRVEIGLSQRGSVQQELSVLNRRIHAIGRLAGARAVDRNSYPGWKPDLESPLLAHCRTVYQNTFGSEPVVEAIHAGLECGVIGAKFENMDMISLGPSIESPHSPDERLHIRSVENVYRFLSAVLQSGPL